MSLSTKHLILGLVVQRPNAHGYALRSEVKERFGFLDLAISAVYGSLERLEKDGLIATSGVKPVGSRELRQREMFHATDQGVREFKTWMAAPSKRPTVRDELQAKIGLATPDDLPDVCRVAEAQLELCVGHLSALPKPSLAVARSSSTAWPEVARIVADDYKTHLLAATIDWLTSTIEVLRARIEQQA